MEQISRRNFIIGTGATIAGFALAGCGNPNERLTIPAVGADPTTPGFAIDQGATVSEQAVRGEQFQIGEPLNRQKYGCQANYTPMF